jgi:hypothetical protein
MIQVPVLTPYLSSLWLGLVTPLYARIGRKLIESIVHSTVVSDGRALEVFDIRPVGIDAAIKLALTREDRELATTRWSDALSSSGELKSHRNVSFGRRLIDSREVTVQAPPVVAFRPIQLIGGEAGWYAFNWLWQLRGLLDLFVGGIGVRRGRSDPHKVRVGDAIDFWRVEAFEPNHRLRLNAEMRLPGRAWLEFEVDGDDTSSTIRQTAIFDPVGLPGRLYWYVLYPIHQLVFGQMLRRIAAAVISDERGCKTAFL